MRQKIISWLNKGDGGYTPYEPYITNRDMIWINIGTLIVCGIIMIAGYLINI